MTTTPWLSPQVFAILSALVEERLGLHHAVEDRSIFADKVQARAAEAGFETALDYYYFLRYDAAAPAELEALADALVVGETYFFRELEPLRAAIEHVVVPAIAARGSARIWSAACATGEEPLSLAMLLEERGIHGSCAIIATDLSLRSLKRAREGLYGGRSRRLLPPQAPPKSWSPALGAIVDASLVPAGDRLKAAASLVARIDYRPLNLLDAAAVSGLGSFDLVLCRNVLIYFSDETVKRVVQSISNVLENDGRLLIGASESLLRFGTVLRCEERGGAFFYAKDLR